MLALCQVFSVLLLTILIVPTATMETDVLQLQV